MGALDSQILELQGNLEEANDIAAKGGRTAMAKLEARVRELEMELGTAQCRTSDTYKGFQKSERKIKELQFQQDEDVKNQERMTDLAQKLQQKIKTYKNQKEDQRLQKANYQMLVMNELIPLQCEKYQ